MKRDNHDLPSYQYRWHYHKYQEATHDRCSSHVDHHKDFLYCKAKDFSFLAWLLDFVADKCLQLAYNFSVVRSKQQQVTVIL
jgi:hypothetical protein